MLLLIFEVKIIFLMNRVEDVDIGTTNHVKNHERVRRGVKLTG